jgi:hypothetical protein
MYVSTRPYDLGSLPAPGMPVSGCCGGMGGLTQDGSGLFGTGIFGTSVQPLNLSTWTWAEYAAVGVGLFAAMSMFGSTKRGYQGARRRIRAAANANPSRRRR